MTPDVLRLVLWALSTGFVTGAVFFGTPPRLADHQHDAADDARVKDGRASPALGAGMPQGMAEPSRRREQVDVPRE